MWFLFKNFGGCNVVAIDQCNQLSLGGLPSSLVPQAITWFTFLTATPQSQSN